MEATQVPPQQPNPKIQAIVKSIILFFKIIFTNEKKSEIGTNLADNSFSRNSPMFLLYFIYIALLDKNLTRSKKDHTYKNLKSLFLYGQTKIEDWETILVRFLNENPRSQGFPWTDEEKEVWKLVLFFTSEQFGSTSITGCRFYFMLENQERKAQLSPIICQLGLKPFKETATSIAVNPCAKKYQTVLCEICQFHGDPKNPSKTCGCCYECRSRDSDCRRCRICREHDSTKCTCCPICNTSAEGC